MGIGMGAKGSTVPVLAAENSPSNIRGALTVGPVRQENCYYKAEHELYCAYQMT